MPTQHNRSSTARSHTYTLIQSQSHSHKAHGITSTHEKKSKACDHTEMKNELNCLCECVSEYQFIDAG